MLDLQDTLRLERMFLESVDLDILSNLRRFQTSFQTLSVNFALFLNRFGEAVSYIELVEP